MKKLIKTICGESCEVYAISHHNRILVGKAIPNIEIYENSFEVPTIGTNRVYFKRTTLSICICSNPEMSSNITDEIIKDISAFDLSMVLQRKDDVFVPFMLYSVSQAEISSERWVFEITDTETINKLLAL